MKKKLLAITIITCFLAMGFSSAIASDIESVERQESKPNSSYKVYPLASIELNDDSSVHLATFLLKLPIYAKNGPVPPINCIIFGLVHLEITSGSLTLKSLNKESITLYTGTILALHGFIGKAEGKTDWRDRDFSSLSGKGSIIVVELP